MNKPITFKHLTLLLVFIFLLLGVVRIIHDIYDSGYAAGEVDMKLTEYDIAYHVGYTDGLFENIGDPIGFGFKIASSSEVRYPCPDSGDAYCYRLQH